MNLELVEKIADAVLYEGYILYPYRASAVKNRQRFNWGVLVPQSYSAAQRGTENCRMQTEILVSGDENTVIDLKLRCLHLRDREIYQVDETTLELFPVESMEVDGRIFQSWQEAAEREVNVSSISLNAVIEKTKRVNFSFPSSEELESLCDADGKTVGAIVRRQKILEGVIEIRSAKVEVRNSDSVFKLTARVSNTTPFEDASQKSRDEALAHSLVSAHAIFRARGGEFVSLLEAPAEFGAAVASCKNTVTYPVLVGADGERDCMLSSPIILYDYPQIAPESPGELFDGAEIDEILTLRILTMTDEEKREMLSIDERTRKILERSENLSPEQFMKLHGVLREPRSLG